MSLLEDVFLQDEANEAQELERVIEGDEFDDRPRSRLDSDNNSERENEAEEERKRVDPSSTKTRRVIKNPRFILNPARLNGPRGIHIIPDHYKDFKFKGKGHEKEDLDLVLKKLEHWAYRLYPKFKFEDCLKKIETLGKKRPVMVHLHKIRSDQYLSDETVVQKDSSDDEALPEEAPPEDEFDKLLRQQIELAHSTPAPSSAKKGIDSLARDNRSLIMPKATSSPSISDEQRERILKSRKLAEERRLARLKNASNTSDSKLQIVIEDITNTPVKTDNISYNFDKVLTEDTIEKNSKNNKNIIDIDDNDVGIVRKVNRSNMIDSSDEDEVVLMNEPVQIDIHETNTNTQTNIGLNNLEIVLSEDKFEKVNSDNMQKVIDNQDNDVGILCKIDRSNVIANSDILMNESVEINVHENNINKPANNDNVSYNLELPEDIIKRNNRANIIDSSDEDNVPMNESGQINIHENTKPANTNKISCSIEKVLPEFTIEKNSNNIQKAINIEDNNVSILRNVNSTNLTDNVSYNHDKLLPEDTFAKNSDNVNNDSTKMIIDIEDNDVGLVRKCNKSNVIECSNRNNVVLMNESVQIDVHESNNINGKQSHEMTDDHQSDSINKDNNQEILNTDLVKDICDNDKPSDHLQLLTKTTEYSTCLVQKINDENVDVQKDNTVDKVIEDTICDNPVVSGLSETIAENDIEDLMDVDFDDDF